MTAVAITYAIGDATAPTGSGSSITVHVCNDAGKWGRGFVLSVSQRFPLAEQAYRKWFSEKEAKPFALGEVQFVQASSELWVANLVGQHGVRGRNNPAPVRYDAIRTGLAQVAEFARERGASVHMPRIGCGLAGGSWDQIEPIIRDQLADRGVPVTVYDLPDNR